MANPPPLPKKPPPIKKHGSFNALQNNHALFIGVAAVSALMLLMAIGAAFIFLSVNDVETAQVGGGTQPIMPDDPASPNQTLPDPILPDQSSNDVPIPPNTQEDDANSEPEMPSAVEEPFSPPMEETDSGDFPDIPKNSPATTEKDDVGDGKINIKSDSIILTQTVGDFMEEKIELFGKVNYEAFGLQDMSRFKNPTIYAGVANRGRRPTRFMRRPPDHIEWWKHSRANELDLPDEIYRFGSKWNLFDTKGNDRQILVAWHEEKPEIYIRVDSDNPNRPIGPEPLVKLRSDYKAANQELINLRKSIARVPVIKFASAYKINHKLDRLDYQINQYFRLSTSDADDSLESNFRELLEIIVKLPDTLEDISDELYERNQSNRREVTQIAANNPPMQYRNPITGQYTGESSAQWRNRINAMTSVKRKEISAIDSATTNVNAQIALLVSTLQEGVEKLDQIRQEIERIKSLPELNFTLPESLLIKTSSGDTIDQPLRFDVILHD